MKSRAARVYIHYILNRFNIYTTHAEKTYREATFILAAIPVSACYICDICRLWEVTKEKRRGSQKTNPKKPKTRRMPVDCPEWSLMTWPRERRVCVCVSQCAPILKLSNWLESRVKLFYSFLFGGINSRIPEM